MGPGPRPRAPGRAPRWAHPGTWAPPFPRKTFRKNSSRKKTTLWAPEKLLLETFSKNGALTMGANGPKQALGPTGPWAQTGPGLKWALGPNGRWAQMGPGPKWALGQMG